MDPAQPTGAADFEKGGRPIGIRNRVETELSENKHGYVFFTSSHDRGGYTPSEPSKGASEWWDWAYMGPSEARAFDLQGMISGLYMGDLGGAGPLRPPSDSQEPVAYMATSTSEAPSENECDVVITGMFWRYAWAVLNER